MLLGAGGGGEFPQTTISMNPSYFHTKQKEFTTKRTAIPIFCLTLCLLIAHTGLHVVATAK